MHVLLINEEPALCNALAISLRHCGHTVTVMGSAARARAVVPNVAPPELLIANTELGKPGCGLAIAEWIRNFWPRLPALLISAGCATEIPEEICAPTTLLRIPFTLTEMSAAILEVAAPLVGAGMI